MGFSRQEYWSGLPFPSPGDLPNSGIEPRSPALQADALTSEPHQGRVFLGVCKFPNQIPDTYSSYCEVNWNLLSCVWLFVTLWTVACQAPLSMGFSRQEYWSGLPFPSPGNLPGSGIKPRSPTLQADALTSEPPRKSDWLQRRTLTQHGAIRLLWKYRIWSVCPNLTLHTV